MIEVVSVYEDVHDALFVESNGDFPYALFNRYSKIAELCIMDWITGDIRGKVPPEPYLTQKNKDWCAQFIKKGKLPVTSTGEVAFPKDYYGFENMYMIGNFGRKNTECAESDEAKEYNVLDDSNTPIELLDGGQFTERCGTYIKGLAPSFTKPIAKVVGSTFEFMPKDLGSIGLEYYRYPVYAEIKTMVDTVLHDEVPNLATTINYEWDEKVRNILIWFIVDRYSNRTSNSSIKEFNTATGKTAQG